jgi:hypothetical protein
VDPPKEVATHRRVAESAEEISLVAENQLILGKTDKLGVLSASAVRSELC